MGKQIGWDEPLRGRYNVHLPNASILVECVHELPAMAVVTFAMGRSKGCDSLDDPRRLYATPVIEESSDAHDLTLTKAR